MIDVTGKGKLANLSDELLALFTGTRIIRIDVKDDLKFLASNANRLLRAADETEIHLNWIHADFYKSRNWVASAAGSSCIEWNFYSAGKSWNHDLFHVALHLNFP